MKELREAIEQAAEIEESSADATPLEPDNQASAPPEAPPLQESGTPQTTEAEEVPGEKKPPLPESEEGAEEAKTSEQPEDTGPSLRVDRAPQSWKGEAKKHWDELPLDVRRDVIRREREIEANFRETKDVKAIAQTFAEVIQPHQDWLKTTGINPAVATANLLNVERALRFGTPQEKAHIAVSMLTNFGIDLSLVEDGLMAGQQQRQQQQPASDVQALIQKELGPLKEFVSQTAQQQARQKEMEEAAARQELKKFEASHPYFEDVKDEMVAFYEVYSKRGQNLSLENAYELALKAHPELQQAEQLKKQQLSSNKVRSSAASVGGAATGPANTSTIDPSNLRAYLEAQLNSSDRI